MRQGDRAVLVTHSWLNFVPQCEFLLDYEDEAGKSQRKNPWRYRWSEATHDEVLARLLDLNQKRDEQEILGGVSGKKSKKRPSSTPTIFGIDCRLDKGRI